MSTRAIGGVKRYDLLAQLHRPTDSTALSEEVRRLARNGLPQREILTAFLRAVHFGDLERSAKELEKLGL